MLFNHTALFLANAHIFPLRMCLYCEFGNNFVDMASSMKGIGNHKQMIIKD